MAKKLKIAILLSGEPLLESYDIGKDGICIEKRLIQDLSAAEEASIEQARSMNPEKITAIAWGCLSQANLLRKALALGADEAIWIGKEDWSDKPDTRIIAEAVKSVVADYDLLLTADMGSSLYGSELSVACAVALGWRCFNGIMSYEVGEDNVTAKRKLEDGKRQEVLADLPVVLGILSDNEYCAYYSLQGKLAAENTEVEHLDISYAMLARQIGVQLETDYWQKSTLRPQTKVVWQPDARLSGGQRLDAMINGEVEAKHGVVVNGTAKECADKIVEYLLENKIIENA